MNAGILPTYTASVSCPAKLALTNIYEAAQHHIYLAYKWRLVKF